MSGNADVVRLLCLSAVLVAVACGERAWPRRARVAPAMARWRTNLLLMASGSVLARLLVSGGAVGAAVWAERSRVGALNLTDWPAALKWALAVAWLDLVVYWQHRAFHRYSPLWRLHAVHHTDLDLDASSGVRFHPLEIVLSMGVKTAAVALLGAPVGAVTAFEVVLNATAVFNHGNLAVPPVWDRRLRWALVTPDMHRVHHTTRRDEQDSNFGFNIPWWDRLFGTYRDQPREGHERARLGLAGDRDPGALGFGALLARPFSASGARERAS